MANEQRIEELKQKARDQGLSDDEADELGRLYAEQEGKPYSNAKLSKAPPGEQGADLPAGEGEPDAAAYRSSEENPDIPPSEAAKQ